MIKKLLIICALVITPLHAFDAFDVPANVQATLDEVFSDKEVMDAFLGITKFSDKKSQCSFIKKRSELVLRDTARRHGAHPALPGYIIKGGRHGAANAHRLRENVGRVAGGERFREVIARLGAEHVTVPCEWLYHLPGQPDELTNDNFIVISQKLDVLPRKENKAALWNLDSAIARELRDVLLTVRYGSLHSSNIIMLRDRQTVAIVDTEEWPKPPSARSCMQRFRQMVDPMIVDALE